MSLLLLALIAAGLAFVNGANDNSKGAATLVGSGLVSPRSGLVLATAMTAAGGLLSVLLAQGLLAAFSGKGLVPDSVAGSAQFLLPVGLAAAATVALATWLRMPISTTHALVGGLLGAGAVAAPQSMQWNAALSSLAAPLLMVPLTALLLALVLAPLMKRLRNRAARVAEPCVCEVEGAVALGANGTAALRSRLQIGRRQSTACAEARPLLSLSAERAMDIGHLLSAMAVSFARGLNDTPKIAAIALAGGLLGGWQASLMVVAAMAAGGLLAGSRIADTMAFRITRMDPAEGLSGNLVASSLILAASPLGLPVSTTHVTVGALFGIAAGHRGSQWRTIGRIALSWLLTLPLAASLAVLFHYLFH